MAQAMSMRFLESACDLLRIRHCLTQRNRTLRNSRGKRLAVKIFHHQILEIILAANVVENADMRMIEGGNSLGFPFESLSKLGPVRKVCSENLDCDLAVETGVPRSINLSHSASSDCGKDFVRS